MYMLQITEIIKVVPKWQRECCWKSFFTGRQFSLFCYMLTQIEWHAGFCVTFWCGLRFLYCQLGSVFIM